MERRYSVGAPRQSQREHRHAEKFVRIVGILSAESQQTFLGEPERLAQRADMLLAQAPYEPRDPPGSEAVVPRRYRSVRGKHDFPRDSRNRCLKRNPFLLHP